MHKWEKSSLKHLMPSVITVSTNIFINLWHIVDKTQGVNSCKGTEQGNEIEDLLSLLQSHNWGL